MNILTEYPIWFLFFCLAAGLLFALALYYRERRSEFSTAGKRLMMFIRFISISLISFLLLSPLFRIQVKLEDKPRLLVFQDNSRSVPENNDSVFYQNEYGKKLDRLIEQTGDKYDTELFYFSDEVSRGGELDFGGMRTNISGVFGFLENIYSNRNVGAAVIATDGIYNAGRNPAYSSLSLNFPVYTLALGDTMKRIDLRINDVNFNEIAFLGNEFPIEVNVHADKMQGNDIKLQVKKNARILASRQITITDDVFNQDVRFYLEAASTGLQKYSIEVSEFERESNTANNQQDIFIDVIDTRLKILVLYNSPHPDIAALRSVLSQKEQYEIDVYPVEQFPGNMEQYNLLIFHQLPSGSFASVKIREETAAVGIPVLYILGSQTNLGFFNNMKSGLRISDQMGFEDAYPALNENFNLFTMSESLRAAINYFPPLRVYFGNYLASNSAQVMLDQKIGNLKTQKPLILFNTTMEEKSAVIAGEGLWRWRINDHVRNQSQSNFDELISKIVQYLSLKVDKKQFRLEIDKVMNEFDDIKIRAALYNENYELVNEAEVNLIITDDKGKEYPFIMGRKGDAYFLNAGSLPPGNYSYRAFTKRNDQRLEESGSFTVKKSNLEKTVLTANHNLLYRLSAKYNGNIYYPAEMEQLQEELLENKTASSVLSYRQKYTELLNLPWLLGVLLFLMAAEWFLRKWQGSY